MKCVLSLILCLSILIQAGSCSKYYVYNLATDLIYETDVVFSNGFRTNLKIYDIDFSDSLKKKYEYAEIRSEQPRFSWMIYSQKNNTYQIKYRIQLASSLEKLVDNKPDMWDSKDVTDSSSTGIVYKGKKLKGQTIYFWRVKIEDNSKRKYPWSEPKAFITDIELDNSVSVLPLEKTIETPDKIFSNGKNTLIDFSRDAFSQIKFRLNSFTDNTDTVTVHFGEKLSGDSIDRAPGYCIRYSQYAFTLKKGYNNYQIQFKPDLRNTDPNQNESGVSPVLMPSEIGEVFPFRYCEIENYKSAILYSNIERHVVSYPFDESQSFFVCSDTTLNQIYDLCKWTMKATSFCGVFVDGDRERIPYEADALINQLSYFAVSNQYSISRNTVERLMYNPTWPTEWILQALIIAWNDYLYSGDSSLLEKVYNDLKVKTLNDLRNYDDNLIHTGDTIFDVNMFSKLHFKGKNIRDIVDWPRYYADDEYDFTECNTVVNAYYYMALKLMSKIAMSVSNKYDSRFFNKLALETKESFNNLLKDSLGLFVDGIGSKHNSLHANMFPLAFGMVDENSSIKIADFIASKGMACSVYGSQFLLDALYESGEDFYALKLLCDTTQNSWYNMIRSGSTMTMEAWDNSIKYNNDWNHAWGAAALNIIVRKIAGIEPLQAGFSRVRIHPQPGNLETLTLKTPSPKGIFEISFNNKVGEKFEMNVTIPPNVTAEVYLPGKLEPKIVGSGNWHFKND